MSRVIVLGADGQLGRALCQQLKSRGDEVVDLTVDDVDLSHPSTIELPLDGAEVVINCAAYTNVDGAEENEAEATRINGDAVSVLAEACREASIPLVHYSTDYVFDGSGGSPISPEAARAPLNAYGRSKARGEELLEASGADYLLIRTSWVYAPWGNNFALTMKRLMADKDELKVVDDQRGRPTHVEGLAERTLALLDRGERGIFHVTDDGECTWFEFAQAIREALGSSCRVSPCTTAEFPRPAIRPPYGVLDTSKADALLGKAVHYRDRLGAMFAE